MQLVSVPAHYKQVLRLICIYYDNYNNDKAYNHIYHDNNNHDKAYNHIHYYDNNDNKADIRNELMELTKMVGALISSLQKQENNPEGNDW